KEISMDSYKGSVVLVVNTASNCGFTPQFEGLETLYSTYKDKGFVILGFPCNQFANQEPGDEKSIAEGCVLNYGVTFPMFAKIDVNGEFEHPLYSFMKQSFPGKISWNFTKFLIDSHGTVVYRFPPKTKPEEIEVYIQNLLMSTKK